MKITSIEAFPVRLPRTGGQAVGTAGSPTPLEPGSGPYRWSKTVATLYSLHFETALIKVSGDTGLTGWGEAQAPLAPEVACEIVRLLLRPVLEGAEFDGSVEAIRECWDRMYQTMRVRGQTGGFMLDAIGGVDIALWDLAGQMQRKPVGELIGGVHLPVSVPAYFSGVNGGTIPECIENAKRAAGDGFHVFKLFHDREAGDLFARLDALAANLDAGTRFAVDALWRLDPASAPAFGRELDRRNALWLEAPLPPEDAAAHAALARVIRTPIAVGESYRTRFEIAPFLEQGAAAIVQPDLGRCGITEFLRIAEMARSRGARVVPHVSIALGPQIAAAIHAAAACGCELLEFNPNVLQVANAYLDEPLVAAAAAYRVPEGPGLGIRVNQRKLAEAHLTI
ncbi:MAG: mandelate racemase/muconate lactonizing enzyme family protein [Bryobacteraceae bacterium]